MLVIVSYSPHVKIKLKFTNVLFIEWSDAILQYMRTEYPGNVPGEPNPRLSLHLSSYLVHGTILCLQRQVNYALGNNKYILFSVVEL